MNGGSESRRTFGFKIKSNPFGWVTSITGADVEFSAHDREAWRFPTWGEASSTARLIKHLTGQQPRIIKTGQPVRLSGGKHDLRIAK